jgi:hypothetical protein
MTTIKINGKLGQSHDIGEHEVDLQCPIGITGSLAPSVADAIWGSADITEVKEVNAGGFDVSIGFDIISSTHQPYFSGNLESPPENEEYTIDDIDIKSFNGQSVPLNAREILNNSPDLVDSIIKAYQEKYTKSKMTNALTRSHEDY